MMLLALREPLRGRPASASPRGRTACARYDVRWSKARMYRGRSYPGLIGLLLGWWERVEVSGVGVARRLAETAMNTDRPPASASTAARPAACPRRRGRAATGWRRAGRGRGSSGGRGPRRARRARPRCSTASPTASDMTAIAVAGGRVLAQPAADRVEVERPLGDEHVVDPGRGRHRVGEIAVRRPERLDDEAAAGQRAPVIAQPVDRVEGVADGGVHADRRLGAGDVVIDRGGDERDREVAGQRPRALRRAVSADHEQGGEPERGEARRGRRRGPSGVASARPAARPEPRARLVRVRAGVEPASIALGARLPRGPAKPPRTPTARPPSASARSQAPAMTAFMPGRVAAAGEDADARGSHAEVERTRKNSKHKSATEYRRIDEYDPRR